MGPAGMAGAGGSDRQWLETVLDLLPVAFLLVEPGSGRVLFANPPAGRLVLEPPDSGSDGGDAWYATDEEGRRVSPEELPRQRAARGERLAGLQITWHTPEGQVSYLVFSGAVPALPGHEPLVVMTYLDVTRLIAAEGELVQAVRARDEFFSIATHELKDPLASLQLSVELLRRLVERYGTVPPNALLQHLEVSKRQGDRLARLIENLLDVSRITSGRLQVDAEAFDLCQLVREVAGRFQEQARLTGSTVAVDARGSVIGYWDRQKLDQVVSNLLSNALKYGAGQPVTVRAHATESRAVIEVEDHGIGIAAEDQGRIFERFERATSACKRQSLGLGLYIVRSIVEAHGGSVGLRSEPGKGSTFTVELPRKRLPGQEAEPAE